MNIREKIGQMPAWKAGMLAILSVGLIVIVIEEYCINKIFSVMNNLVANFEVQFADDIKDMKDDDRKYNEEHEYDKAKSDLIRFRLNEQPYGSDHTQEYYCAYLIINKKLEKFYDLAYVKHHSETRQYITREIEQNKKFIEAASQKKIFDTSQCKDSSK